MGRLLAVLALTLAALAAARPGFTAAVPPAERAARLTLLRSWLDAGRDLGDHICSHPDLRATPLADEAWRSPEEFVGRQGTSWLHRFRVAKGLPVRFDLDPDPPKRVLDLYSEEQAR